MSLEISITLYSIQEAITRLKELGGRNYSDQGLRNRLKAENIHVHHLGKMDMVTELDLLRLLHRPKPRIGRPKIIIDLQQ